MLADVAGNGTRAHAFDFIVKTRRETELIDMTQRIEGVVEASAVANGLALVSVPHTTCGLVLNEDEPGFREDFRAAIERLAPRQGVYAHDRAHDGIEEPNGFAHVRSALLGLNSLLLPIRDGRLALGTWQRIFLAELDRPRTRTVQITVLGV